MENQANAPCQTRSEAAATKSCADADFIMGTSPGMRVLERAIADLANCFVPVLLLGEAGTGKCTLARHIHLTSARSHLPFIHLPCESITPTFFEAATATGRDAIVRLANLQPGTLYLDEITDLAHACQAQLLHQFFNSAPNNGSAGWRLIMSSRRDLEQEVREERLDEDLYYQVRGICLQIPPLRHRREDIPELLESFLARHSSVLDRRHPQLNAQALQLMVNHRWPGNLQQLQETAKTLVLNGRHEYTSEEISAIIGHTSKEGVVSLKQAAREASRQAERELILRVLARTRGNRKRAAQELQISYKALLYKLKQIAVEDGSADLRGKTL